MAVSFIRTLIIFFILFAAMRIMGKRELGELEPIELVVAILISNLASQPLADSGIPLIYGLIPVFTLLSCQVLISWLSVKSIKVRRLLGGQPAVIIDNGKIDQAELRKNRISLDELFVELRRSGVGRVENVRRAVLEPDGTVSVMPYQRCSPVTPDMLGLSVKEEDIPIAVISDGRTLNDSLRRLGYNEKWLLSELKKRGLSAPEDVFLMVADAGGKVYIAAREEKE